MAWSGARAPTSPHRRPRLGTTARVALSDRHRFRLEVDKCNRRLIKQLHCARIQQSSIAGFD